MIKTETFTAPAALASYFVDGDASIFDYIGGEQGERDHAAADAWLASIAPARIVAPVDIENTFFSARHDALAFIPYAAECVEYIAHVEN